MAVQKLAHQYKRLERVNTLIGILLLAVLAVAALVFTSGESPIGSVVTIFLLLVAVEELGRASRLWSQADAPVPRKLASFAVHSPDYMKEKALPEVLTVLDENLPAIERKEGRVNRAAAFLGLGAVALLVDRFVPAAVKFLPQVHGIVHQLSH